MIGTSQGRPPTRVVLAPDVPRFDLGAMEPPTRDALTELLLTIADDEFVLGFWDSEWTGIAPMLEEDVAFSSLAQDEIGHARVLYEMFAQITGQDADRVAFGRPPEAYRHCQLVDHRRTDWAFSICRRWLYDLADYVRLGALAPSSFSPLAEVVTKIRREESYHLAHMDLWMRRLAKGGEGSRERTREALAKVWPDIASPFAPLAGEDRLLEAGILEAPMTVLAERHLGMVTSVLDGLHLTPVIASRPAHEGRKRPPVSDGFRWLWNEFTMVHRLDEGATW